jgi:hypothetical protein
MKRSKGLWALVALVAVGALLVRAARTRRAPEPIPAETRPSAAPAEGEPAAAPAGLLALLDVDYGLPGRHHPDQRLDLYRLPAAERGPAPTLILLHGGGFHAGDEQIEIADPPYVDWLERGWAIASAQYRLAPSTCADMADPDHPHRSFYPEPEHDVSLLVQFLRLQSADWNLDPEKLVLRGISAGGGLATFVGLADERALLDDGVGHRGLSTRVRAIVNVGGPTDATYANAHGPFNFSHVGYYVDCRASRPYPSLETLFELSASWNALREPQNALNQLVAVRHEFAGPLGGDIHDPFYGQVLHDALRDPRVANPSSFLDWDQGLSAPTGLDPTISESDWLELQFASTPFGAGTPGTLPRPPALALVGFGPCESLLVANCLPGAEVTLLEGSSPLAAAEPGGNWLAQPVEIGWRVADARGEALFDVDAAVLSGTGRKRWLQAAGADELAPGGRASTHGLRLELP